MHKIGPLSILALGFAFSCAPKVKTVQTYQPLAASQDAVPRISYEPTNPNGGTIPYKPAAEMSPEEAARRKAKNEVQTMIFGLAAGGVSMQTTLKQSLDILSPAVQEIQGYTIYPERIAVRWNDTGDRTPLAIQILPDHPGPLPLRDPVGVTHIGESWKASLSSEERLLSYLKELGAAIEKRTNDYDCTQDKTCRLSLINPGSKDAYDLEFRRGFLRISGDGEFRLEVIAFDQPKSLPPRLLEPIDYQNQTIGGFSLAQTKSEIQAHLGSPVADDAFATYFDRGSFALRKGSDLRFAAGLAALQGYQAPLAFGGSLGTRYIGQSFADVSKPEDDGTQLMLTLDRTLHNRAADFDCRKLEKPCRLDPLGGAFAITLEKGIFVFTDSIDRTWLSIEIPRI